MDGEPNPAATAAAQDPNLLAGADPNLLANPDDPNAQIGLAPEDEKVEEIIPEEILEDMKNLWSVFDMEQTESVDRAHLRVIMRALDFDLDADQLKVVEDQIDPGDTGKITF